MRRSRSCGAAECSCPARSALSSRRPAPSRLRCRRRLAPGSPLHRRCRARPSWRATAAASGQRQRGVLQLDASSETVRLRYNSPCPTRRPRPQADPGTDRAHVPRHLDQRRQRNLVQLRAGLPVRRRKENPRRGRRARAGASGARSASSSFSPRRSSVPLKGKLPASALRQQIPAMHVVHLKLPGDLQAGRRLRSTALAAR